MTPIRHGLYWADDVAPAATPVYCIPWAVRVALVLGAVVWALAFVGVRSLFAQGGASMEWAVKTQRASTWMETTPPEYRAWWDALTKDCEGWAKAERADVNCGAVPFEAVAFRRLPGNTFECDGRARCYGAFVQGYNTLFVAAAHVRDGRVVRHEMLHAILGRADHPPLFRALGLDDLDEMAGR